MNAPDGWNWARFLELFLNFGGFPFPSVSLPSRRYPQGAMQTPTVSLPVLV
jgi:hypothetical protein